MYRPRRARRRWTLRTRSLHCTSALFAGRAMFYPCSQRFACSPSAERSTAPPCGAHRKLKSGPFAGRGRSARASARDLGVAVLSHLLSPLSMVAKRPILPRPKLVMLAAVPRRTLPEASV